MIDYNKFHGIILYDIELNDCLNGAYTNNDKTVDGNIYNEIARKKNGIKNSILGDYTCSYIDVGNVIHEATLIITLITGLSQSYSFTWNDNNGRMIFNGIGYKMNEKQIAVYYKKS